MSFTRQGDDAETITQGFRRFPSGVAAVCAMVDGTPTGMALSSFTPVSISPPLVSICPQATSSTWPLLRIRPYLGISILAHDQIMLCRSLASRKGNRFSDVDWESDEHGAVFIRGAVTQFSCRVRTEQSAGDHSLVLLEVQSINTTNAAPLVYVDSGYRKLHVDQLVAN